MNVLRPGVVGEISGGNAARKRKMKNNETLPVPGAWYPFVSGRPKNGYTVVTKPDGTRWQRPLTAEELVTRAAAKTNPPKTPQEGAVRLTVLRMADGLRTHMQCREGFDAVMQAANLSEKAIANLMLWLTDWQTKAVQRAIDAKKAAVEAAQAAARKAETELREMVNAASKNIATK